MMVKTEPDHPPSPPVKLVTPSQNRHDTAAGTRSRAERPVVYQVYGNAPESRNPFPGGFSPVRTSRSLQQPSSAESSHENHPHDEDTEDTHADLYASFSPPRGAPLRSRHQHPHQHAHDERSPGSAAQKTSIFRPRQKSIIVARGAPKDDPLALPYMPKHASPVTSSAACPSKDRILAFPSKLHQILSAPEYQGYITWLPHGRAWRVLKPKAFEENIIPKFFRSSKYASFMRQVNGWGFVRITTPGPDFNAYWHELFLRGLPDLCLRMKRPQKSDNDGRHEDPPDFYRVHKFSPLPPPPMAVGQSSSLSSDDAKEPARGVEEGRAYGRQQQDIPSLDSWDHKESRRGTASATALSEADCHYLVQQNQALLEHAHQHQARYQHGP